MAGRTAKADTRREDILKAAGACFGEKGFRGCGVSDICARLGISPGHLYYYFKSKDAILAALLERRLKRSTDEISALAERPGALEILLGSDYLIEINDRRDDETYLDAATMWESYAEAARGGEFADLTALHWRATHDALRALVLKAQTRGEVRTGADIDRMLIALEMYIVTLQLAERVNPDFRAAAYQDAGRAMLAPFLTEPAATSRPAKRGA